MTTRRHPHKFRFQVVHQWLTNLYPVCAALDIGGGKGLLAYLLNQSGWQTTVIDPNLQILDWKYKDFGTNKQIKLTLDQRNSVPHLTTQFTPEIARRTQLLIGLHAHGSNMAIIDTAAKYSLDIALIPCCVIDEPIVKHPGINWLASLIEYAKEKNLKPKTTTLPFVGQSTVIYTQNHLIK